MEEHWERGRAGLGGLKGHSKGAGGAGAAGSMHCGFCVLERHPTFCASLRCAALCCAAHTLLSALHCAALCYAALQDDLLYETLTVQETLYFAAMLRLPSYMSKADKVRCALDCTAQPGRRVVTMSPL